MSKVTILQVVPRLDAGGSEQTTVEIADALARAGARALVATEGGRMATAIERSGGEIVPLPLASKNPLTVLSNTRALARLIEERGVDLVHARSRAPAWSALRAARATSRPFVTTYHGAYGKPGPLKALYNSVMGRGDRFIANSEYTASLIASRQPEARARVRVIYRGVDSAVFDPQAVPGERVAALRQAWGVEPGTRIVLHAARLSGLKGQRQTIEAASRLVRDGKLQLRQSAPVETPQLEVPAAEAEDDDVIEATAKPVPAQAHTSTELLELLQGTTTDAPLCVTCGTKMRPAGSCYVCEGCGSTSGCS